MTTDEALRPRCECGLVVCGLVWIPDENRYQCGTCIHATYARIAKLEAVKAAIARNGHRPWITEFDGHDRCITCWTLGDPHLPNCVYRALDALLDETETETV